MIHMQRVTRFLIGFLVAMIVMPFVLAATFVAATLSAIFKQRSLTANNSFKPKPLRGSA